MQECYRGKKDQWFFPSKNVCYNYWIGENWILSFAEAAQFQGKNTLQNIRETIKRHVNNNKDTMFAKAKDVMMEKLMKLMVCVEIKTELSLYFFLHSVHSEKISVKSCHFQLFFFSYFFFFYRFCQFTSTKTYGYYNQNTELHHCKLRWKLYFLTKDKDSAKKEKVFF